MARLLSQQDDFANQEPMPETLIKKTGHLCIFLPKFHCELNPIEMASGLLHFNVRDSDSESSCWQYWGWCKYRYRERPKNNFAEAKQAAVQFLDACPLDVLRRFINRSWRFMSAYRKGLNGEAAVWAVRNTALYLKLPYI
ncbi:hypothetical protein AZE42_10223 [Rhizopogon vesiculosus]|uniref:Tc1-like transposase DDE domain-containing protein n=1 Tax=Rhizopogon vesiculosus TaxID=180088 RepID=A0A1J8QV21_9AGAM|nr:hypothetical protein AZE42_10223 [Rhizopogon vesiculosus]